MKPRLPNFFMKKLMRECVVSIISVSVSWLIFANPGSGGLTFPGGRSARKTRYAVGSDSSCANCCPMPAQTSLLTMCVLQYDRNPPYSRDLFR